MHCHYYRIIFESSVQHHRLQQAQATHYWTLNGHVIARVSVMVMGMSYTYESSPKSDLNSAEEQAYDKAITGLKHRGFERRHYRTDLNNLSQLHRFDVRYERKCIGPTNSCVWESRVYIDGIPEQYVARASQKNFADELAAKMTVDKFDQGTHSWF